MTKRVAGITSGRGFPGSPDLRAARSPAGESWPAFRSRLTPRYRMAWREIATCYLMIAGAVLAICLVNERAGNPTALLLVLPIAAWNGYWLLSLNNFVHEAAHWNLAARKRINDLLANALVSVLFGQDVRGYRQVHWAHHLHLGDPQDTEVSYHNRPGPGFLVQTAAGIHVARVLWGYVLGGGRSRPGVAPAGGEALRRRWLLALARAALLHGAFLLGTLRAGWYAAALCWVLSFISAYPTLNALRQILEHRSVTAAPGADFTRVSHGAVNRMFGGGWLARTFGSAGFNRHLLHHWDPAISYTRFDEMESFFSRTGLAAAIDASRTTYFRTLRALLAAGS